MKFREALKKMMDDFNKLIGKNICLDGKHCPEAWAPFTPTFGTPVDVGTANQEGTAVSLARSDHVHRGQLWSGLLADRPAPGVADRYYWATDVLTLFRDTGADWEVVGAQWYERYIDTIFGHGTETFVPPGAIGRVYYSPIVINRTVTIDRIGVVTVSYTHLTLPTICSV